MGLHLLLQVCSVLGRPYHQVTVKCKRTGGAFGGKERWLSILDTTPFRQVFPCPDGRSGSREAEPAG